MDYLLELQFELSLMQFGGEGQGEKWYACVYEMAASAIDAMQMTGTGAAKVG